MKEQKNWNEIYHDYITSDTTLKIICKKYKIYPAYLYQYIKKNELPKRGYKYKKLDIKNSKSTDKKLVLKAILSRKRHLIDQLLKALEMRINAMAHITSEVTENEKDARAINALAKTLETLTQLAQGTKVKQSAEEEERQASFYTDQSSAYIETLREDITKKIDRLAATQKTRDS